MITALAEVVSVQSVEVGLSKNITQYTVQVSCQQQTSCGSCKSQKSCGTGIVSKAFGNKSHAWQFQTDQALKEGDMVEIGLPDKSLVLSSIIIYLFPLLAMILGSVIAHFWLNPLIYGDQGGASEGLVITMFFLFGFVAFFLAKPLIHWLENQIVQQVTLVRVLGKSVI